MFSFSLASIKQINQITNMMTFYPVYLQHNKLLSSVFQVLISATWAPQESDEWVTLFCCYTDAARGDVLLRKAAADAV